MTVYLSVASLLLSLLLGMICAVLQSSRILVLRYLSKLYVTVIRGTPLIKVHGFSKEQARQRAYDMAIGILYESKEWSSYALRNHISVLGVEARLIDMQEEVSEEELLSFDLIINRVFASAVFRGHQKSLQRMPGVIALLKASGIPMMNPYEAHFYEISKAHATKTLAAPGFAVPKVYGVFTPSQITASETIEYPCVIKPDCGGRTNCTFIVRNDWALCARMRDAPDIEFMAEEYIYPEYGYLTRIEVIDRSCKLR